MIRALATAAGLAMLLVGCSPALAQHACGDRAEVIERLADEYGESLRGAGLRDSKSLFEVWANVSTGSWTILLSLPDGRACMIAFGVVWNSRPRGRARIVRKATA